MCYFCDIFIKRCFQSSVKTLNNGANYVGIVSGMKTNSLMFEDFRTVALTNSVHFSGCIVSRFL